MNTLANTGPLTGGTWLGVIIIGVITLACVVGAIVALRPDTRYHPPRRHWEVIGTAVVVLVISWGIWLWGMWPLAYDYHHWVQVEGTVDRVSKRLVSDGDKGMRERYVLVVNGVPRGVDDTRASLVKRGDRVQLACKREYEFGLPRGAHGWGCRWRGRV